MTEETYERPPLLEVIAEVRWKQHKVTSVPNAAIDPFLEPTAAALTTSLGKMGYSKIEKLVPDEVPREFLAGQPLLRFRRQANSWPLFQLGPSVFTANITPPYKGWSSFLLTLRSGLEALLTSFPSAREMMNITRISLRYLNGLGPDHAWTGNADFLKRCLGIELGMPQEWQKVGYSQSPEKMSLELTFGVPAMKDAQMLVKVVPGKLHEKDAILLDLICSHASGTFPAELDPICSWYDEAHKAISQTFETLIRNEARKAMGKKTEVS